MHLNLKLNIEAWSLAFNKLYLIKMMIISNPHFAWAVAEWKFN